ncbi:EF-P beta-lysylation protein EpmB [Litorivivens lipolytica]|uniref:L-lysine 2,3-aminomutase n=1 Tax=Litorivivens lipolytica TaxID=1524264 RepID=A0A7W4Z837_9GAMM|nr:EF-P beta-lysylation protein EpmB [Litorivivens lipolytica]MBB3048541.1 EF-P beta-lysylation protein EpmB [Litorivivens lipolytica]
MIPLSQPQWQLKEGLLKDRPTDSAATDSWQQQLAGACREVPALLAALGLDPAEAPYPLEARSAFPLRVPQAFIDLMQPGNWFDPLLLQVLPLARESEQAPGFSQDPLKERDTNPVPGLIHKYHGRVLLIASPACAVHCRYCFRRHFPYEDNTPSRADWDKALDYIRQRPDITEVILSGGDPLALNDRRLAELVGAINAIDHVTTLRFHTRLPVVLPDRISPELCDTLQAIDKKVVFVIHCNHPAELGEALARSLGKLRALGVTLLNQTVLLSGVNDNAEALSALSRGLFNVGVLPYYLHQLDRVEGAAHFELTDEQARQLHTRLMEQLPGYLVPRLVREDPNIVYKAPLVQATPAGSQ